MSRVLTENGHEVEVLTRAFNEATVVDLNGIRVESVRPRRNWVLSFHHRIKHWHSALKFPMTRLSVAIARALADAFLRRHQENPFDIVQSSNCSLSGLFLPSNRDLVHLVRVSGDYRLWIDKDPSLKNTSDLDIRLHSRLERRTIRHATAAYAPSELISKFWERRYGHRLDVVRPPVLIETQPAETLPGAIPDRYLLHFGALSHLKGTALLAEALSIAWRSEPDLKMVWAGREKTQHFVEQQRAKWGRQADKVVYLGPVSRDVLYAVLKQAVASVLPSRVDNLPNTVIESLMLGVPVIGSAGASIDELVEHGVCGELVPIDDVPALADSMVRAWRGQGAWTKEGFRAPAILDEMAPQRAAENFLQLAMTRV
ncbi:MAG: glycosyltransferase family 4 protein [Planctomycetales bacterium]|nr:glycosyltransferase family 4 protein [Planctomycetales bacterium]